MIEDDRTPSGAGRPARPLRILYLCERRTFETKMSRVRFHGIAAVARRAEVTWSGPGWDGWDACRPAQQNVDRVYAGRPGPDLIVAYKPLLIAGLRETVAPRCVRYNEMYDTAVTQREIVESGANLIVCHHRNDMAEWQERFRGYRGHPLAFVNISHGADTRFYRDWGEPKRHDLLLVGAHGVQTMLGAHYPLRDRLAGILQRLAGRYRCEVHRHPGGELADAARDRNTLAYARALSAAKICVTCSGVPRSRFGKYVEVPMCGAALAADLPGEDRAFFRQFLIEIDAGQSDDRIAQTLSWWLEHDAERAHLVERGLELSRLYTQDKYAERFVQEARWFLRRWPGAAAESTFAPELDDVETDPPATEPAPAAGDMLARAHALLRANDADQALRALDQARRRLPRSFEVAAAWRRLRDVLAPAERDVAPEGWPPAAALRAATTAARARQRAAPLPRPAPPATLGRRPRIRLVADVPDWIFARHAAELEARLGDEFAFSVSFHGAPLDEEAYDLVYALEWNCVEHVEIRDPSRFAAGIRGHASWQHLPFEEFGAYLRARFGAVHAVSRRLQELLRPLVPGIERLAHGVDTARFAPPPAPARGGCRIRVGWAGNHRTAAKQYERLVAPLADVPGVELVVCGRFHGQLDLARMPAFYAGVDVFVCASLHEGASNTVMEAASMARAIVTTDTGNAAEFLADGNSALFVEPELDALVAAVEHLRDHPDRRAALGRAAREAAVAHVDWAHCAEDYRRFFRAALRARGIESTPAPSPAFAGTC